MTPVIIIPTVGLSVAAFVQVVEQNGQWYCEYDGKTYPSMVRRYVTTLRCTDHTAELTLNAFNEQVSHAEGLTHAGFLMYCRPNVRMLTECV